MQDISVSIIIPVYKVEKYIGSCLESIVSQDYSGEIECLLIDDCGGDSSMVIVQEWIARYNGPIKFRILHHDHNRGLSAARNTGISNATGDYLLFVDSDDGLTPNALSSLTKPLYNQQFDFVIGDYKVVGTDKEYPPLLLEDNSNLFENDIFKSYLLGKWYMMAWNKLINREFLSNNSLFFLEGIIHEDDLWSFGLALKAKSMAVTKECCYLYNIREGSITTNSNFEKKFKSRLKIRDSIYDLLQEYNISPTFDLNNFLQSFDFGLLQECYVTHNIRLFNTAYHSFRKSNLRGIDALRINRLNIKKQIRDSHLLFPESIGRQIVKLLTKWLAK